MHLSVIIKVTLYKFSSSITGKSRKGLTCVMTPVAAYFVLKLIRQQRRKCCSFKNSIFYEIFAFRLASSFYFIPTKSNRCLFLNRRSVVKKERLEEWKMRTGKRTNGNG